MKGKHHIIIETKHLKYEFDIRRNITVICGDSATGKTTMIGLLQEYGRRGIASGIRIQSDVECRVFSGAPDEWKGAIKEKQGSIYFFDEGYDFIYGKEFAEALQGTDNYYVIVTRRPLKNLPYSTKEIYGIRTTGRFHFPEQVCHEFYPIIEDNSHPLRDERNREFLLLMEDEKSGYQFFSSITGICRFDLPAGII